MSQKPLNEKDGQRGYVRVSATFPVLYRVIDPQQPKERIEERDLMYFMPPAPGPDVLERVHQGREDANAQVMELLLWLDWKVNYLMKTMRQDKDRQVFPFQGYVADLSATGAKVFGPEKLDPGAHLEFQIILPAIPFREMVLPADVIWCHPVGAGASSDFQFEIGVEFVDVRDADREQMIRYVLSRQMQLRRESLA